VKVLDMKRDKIQV